MAPHLRVKSIDAEPEPFAPQRCGVIYLPGGAGSTDDSYRFDFNTGDTCMDCFNRDTDGSPVDFFTYTPFVD